jgi:mycothiol synthase
MEKIKEGYEARPATEDDIEEILDLYNEYWEVMTGVKKFNLDEFQTFFSAPGFDLGSSMQVVFSPEDGIIAAVLVMDINSPPVHPNVFGCVRAGYDGQGIGTGLLDWAETRAREAVDRCPEGVRVSMYLQSAQSHKPTLHLFEKFKLTPVRYNWFMIKDLDNQLLSPVWPAGIRIQTFKDTSDLETVYKVIDEIFQDHWGHVDSPEDGSKFERFKHSVESNIYFDPSLWYLAMAGDEIAGIALCESRFGDDVETGVVEPLGVRRPWRNQGLGLALLQHAFIDFYKRGYKRVGLGVDTQNLSGATKLYKKAGMRVAHETAIFEKELRAGEELSKQAL